MNRVVITGIAPVNAMGSGNEFFNNLMAMRPVISKADNNYCAGKISSGWYVPYPEVDLAPYMDKLKRMPSLASKNACTAAVAAIIAASDAGISEFDPDTAVFFGVSTMNADDVINAYNLIKGNRRLMPSTNPKAMANAVPAWISILFNVHGRSQVISTACSSGPDAVGAAYEHISMGKSKMAICGGADYMKSDEEMIFRSFDVLGALTRSTDGLPRPFSDQRSGFLFCEGGACALILEEYECALRRNADIYAEITGYDSCCDAYHIVKMPEYPQQAVAMLRKLTQGKKVDYYNAHGTATEVNDRIETIALKEVFGNDLKNVIINATKGITGHCIGTSGAIEAAVCAYSIRHGIVHGNIPGTPFEGLNLPDKTTKADIKCAVSSSFGFGGHNCALMFEKI
ncbi:MAG: beta-ketoacyl-[acyl-carrier-protein] synthase family protein [Oscillospiraceae bacterium]|nr:beta-ketoacyl-[acyl-carrier-protein] synthase family protein [Oscillospiraceae bacterium]